MAETPHTVYTDAQRMELRSLVHLAGEAISQFWPMRTFIHHNPLHGFEDHPFEEAVQRGQQLFGGRGYLAPGDARWLYQAGHIQEHAIEAALRPLAVHDPVELGERKITHADVLRAILVHGLESPSPWQVEALASRTPHRAMLTAVGDRLHPAVEPVCTRPIAAVEQDADDVGSTVTLSGWCDRVLGTTVTAQVNDALIRWCAAFLDEGQATWTMPLRDRSFYGAWRELARLDLGGALAGISKWSDRLAALPALPEDAVLDSLRALEIPKALWSGYLTLHLAALPGWTGVIRWRAGRPDYPWQQAHPISPVKYLAVRLFYERELVGQVCRRHLAIPATCPSVVAWMRKRPEEYLLRREQVAGRLPDPIAARVERLVLGATPNEWRTLMASFASDFGDPMSRNERVCAAWQLLSLARRLALEASVLLTTGAPTLQTLLCWIDGFPENEQARVWFDALEKSFQDSLLQGLAPRLASLGQAEAKPPSVRPSAQTAFCIDVRSEVLRRHLEECGDHETFGIAGFFAVPIRYRAFGGVTSTDLCPVLMKPRHVIREIPRAHQGRAARAHAVMKGLWHAVEETLHDLKENVITPYVMVEAIGWAFGLPFFGKTFAPVWYSRLQQWARRRVLAPVATTLTVDKLSREEAREMVATEQRAAIRQALLERFGSYGVRVDPELIESLRHEALEGTPPAAQAPPTQPGLIPADRAALVQDLRQRWDVNARASASALDRITQTGFTLEEQALFVETALRLIGLTDNFARLVVLCGHGSTSANNPYESALDCGACGGNHGNPNARALAAMANKVVVRAELAKRGIVIPADTHFCAAQHDTTTDEVDLFDLEDAPPTHRHDVTIFIKDVAHAADRTRQERCARLPDGAPARSSGRSARHTRRRSVDWSQVRPEWGLSRNAALIIGRRALTKGLSLEGRCFMHSYDWSRDPTGKSLEIILTGPLIVAQWINMEHYFSTVDNEVYGSGSKAYHNVVGDIGVMYGTQSDLRIGLARQTVMNGERPYHEPVRLTAVIEAPRDRILTAIRRNEILQRLFDLRWVHLIAIEPDGNRLYRYVPKGTWTRVDHEAIAVVDSHEGARP